jgi:hypothetical protein
MDIEAVIDALGTQFDTDETAIIEQVLRDAHGTMPDNQLIEEVGFATAVHRRGRGKGSASRARP